jgi:hypothetical protein
MNDIDINWKKLKFKSKLRSAVEDHPYTREQINWHIKTESFYPLLMEEVTVNFLHYYLLEGEVIRIEYNRI